MRTRAYHETDDPLWTYLVDQKLSKTWLAHHAGIPRTRLYRTCYGMSWYKHEIDQIIETLGLPFEKLFLPNTPISNCRERCSVCQYGWRPRKPRKHSAA